MHYLLAKSGPFNGTDKSLKQSEIVKMRIKLSPSRIPLHSTKRYRANDATVDDY